MELWIRSQDKLDLIKTGILEIGRTDYKEETYKILTLYNDRLVDLGTYETKERALEVLNEIEERVMLINAISLTTDMNSLISFKNAVGEEKINGLGYPYQMPKE